MIKFIGGFSLYIIYFLVCFKGEIIIPICLVIIHEYAHYLMAYILGFKNFSIKILPFGARLDLDDLDEATPREDLLISLAGPLSNLILCVIFFFLYYKFKIEILNVICYSNLALGIFNLIPTLPLDGGRIVRDIINLKVPFKKANVYTVRLSLAIGYFMALLYLTMSLCGKHNILLGLISLLILLTSIKEKERVAYVIMADILKKKLKFIKKGYIENRNISIFYKKDLLTALSLIDKNKYSLFLVLNEEMNVLDIVYEDEVVEAIRDFGNITFEDLIEKNNFMGKVLEGINI